MAVPGHSAPDLLVEQVEALRRSHPEHALRLLVGGFRAASQRAQPLERGTLWRLRGHLLRTMRRAREATRAYRIAQHWFERAGDSREQGRCAIGLVDSLMYLGRYDQARLTARAGRTLLARARDRVSLARLLNNEGNLYHRLDSPSRALARYTEAEIQLRAAGDAHGEAMVQGNMANCLSQLGDCDRARRLYRASLVQHRRTGHTMDALLAEYSLAYLDFLEFRHEQALRGLERVLKRAEGLGNAWIRALCLLDRSEILLRLGAVERALEEATEALRACQPMQLRYERAKAETFAALAEFRLGRSSDARSRLERTLSDFHSEGNRVWLGESLLGYATLWWKDGNGSAAAALLAAAARQFERAGDREREGCARSLLVRVRLDAGDRKGARAAMARLLRGRSREGPRLQHLRLSAQAALARDESRTGDARTLLRRAARASERLAARILDDQWRSSFWGEWSWPHWELAAMELDHGRPREALEALESGRGRTLLGVTTTGRPRASRLPRDVKRWASALLARERERTRHGSAVASPHAPVSPPCALRSRQLHTVLGRVPQRIRASRLQSSLPEGAVALDYLLHRGTLGVIAITRQELCGRNHIAQESRIAHDVHSALFDLRSAAFDRTGDSGTDTTLDHTLRALASQVLWPALELLEFQPTRWAVLPVGPLTRIPWAALPLRKGPALCEAGPVVLVPGLRLGLTRQSARRRDAAAAPLIVASDAGDLDSVREEVESLTRLHPRARVLEAGQATAAAFLSSAGEAEWIHFAGHGAYRADAPEQSGLRMADRWLMAGEVASLSLQARFVTLSACQTARALIRPGEEWFGLPRAFLTAGAGAVLASQWDIADAAATRFMQMAYCELQSGVPVSLAVARTQRSLKAKGLHPYEWAGFVVLSGPGEFGRSPMLK